MWFSGTLIHCLSNILLWHHNIPWHSFHARYRNKKKYLIQSTMFVHFIKPIYFLSSENPCHACKIICCISSPSALAHLIVAWTCFYFINIHSLCSVAFRYFFSPSLSFIFLIMNVISNKKLNEVAMVEPMFMCATQYTLPIF